MRWEKKGLIWGPDGTSSWARHSALQPTAISIGDEVIRVYAGFRDDEGISRVGYVEVSGDDPSRVMAVSERPALDIGRPGTFDENGVVPTAVVARNGKLYLYYAGYQLGHRIRFVVFTGLAVSVDGGRSFNRVHEVPLTDRTDDELYFRVVHCIFEEAGIWRAWYGGGGQFIPYGSQSLAVYDIRYMESPDGFHFPDRGLVVLTLDNPDEHRLGRPCVIKTDDRYRMFYGAATKQNNYRLAYAESRNGVEWTRMDGEIGIVPTPGSWDSDMMAYPNVITHQGRVYLFYNGNEYGKRGFGYAVLREW